MNLPRLSPHLFLAALACAGVLLAPDVGRADLMITASGTNGGSGNALAAEADFSLSGTTLTIVLTNTASNPGATIVPSDILTAVFFNAGGATLTPVSAIETSGSVTVNGPQPAGGNVGGEWAYATGISGPGGTDSGNSSSGFGLFGSGNFNGPDLAGPPSGAVDGAQYGIIESDYVNGGSTNGNPAVNSNPFTQNSVTFTLTTPVGFTLDQISGVNFQYGTALTEPNIPGDPGPPVGVPEIDPASVGSALTLLFGGAMMLIERRRRK